MRGFFHLAGICAAGTAAIHNPAKPNFPSVQKGLCVDKQ